ncbi:hypothetical protein NPIL_113291 [Nephila pilipes]|uniref:Uncharacterized protein n=1 Tax=Nephila pilipes TaxID=299642 RepID=A0A8X6Q0Q7_NEPPI|nr:hypothetical protein NPIL_541301 [Nephila pilipes]GFT93220.1 hypothetical protein NPIL_113291 [Nephila pilipes]
MTSERDNLIMATEMECNNSRPSSPSLNQDKETCETLRLMNERFRILKRQHEDAYSHVCHIESRYMDRESDFYKGAYGLYLASKEAAEEVEAAVANNNQQRAPLDSDIPTQTESGRNRDYRYNTDNRPRPAENNHSDNFYQAIELIANLGEIFNKLPGLIKHLPSIKRCRK